MQTQKRDRILYWIVTLLVLLPPAATALPELFSAGPQATVQFYQALGYPLYLMKILGVFKLLGALAIVANRSRRVSDWAYAGFGILFLGAAASHLLAGDTIHAPIPLIFFVLLVASYVLWTRSAAQASSSLEKD